ncbi:MAG: DUF3291 domain-containing protein [Pseudomonadota bacterium]
MTGKTYQTIPIRGCRLVMYWAPEGHRPAIAEAVGRFVHLEAQGRSDYAFFCYYLARSA